MSDPLLTPDTISVNGRNYRTSDVLAEARAEQVRGALLATGIFAGVIPTVSYGLFPEQPALPRAVTENTGPFKVSPRPGAPAGVSFSPKSAALFALPAPAGVLPPEVFGQRPDYLRGAALPDLHAIATDSSEARIVAFEVQQREQEAQRYARAIEQHTTAAQRAAIVTALTGTDARRATDVEQRALALEATPRLGRPEIHALTPADRAYIVGRIQAGRGEIPAAPPLPPYALALTPDRAVVTRVPPPPPGRPVAPVALLSARPVGVPEPPPGKLPPVVTQLRAATRAEASDRIVDAGLAGRVIPTRYGPVLVRGHRTGAPPEPVVVTDSAAGEVVGNALDLLAERFRRGMALSIISAKLNTDP